MPNWCNNELHVVGPEVDVAKFREKAVGHSPWPEDQTEEEPSPLNLHSLVPIPGDVLAAGYAAGQAWEEANWGCHWGACHHTIWAILRRTIVSGRPTAPR